MSAPGDLHLTLLGQCPVEGRQIVEGLLVRMGHVCSSDTFCDLLLPLLCLPFGSRCMADCRLCLQAHFIPLRALAQASGHAPTEPDNKRKQPWTKGNARRILQLFFQVQLTPTIPAPPSPPAILSCHPPRPRRHPPDTCHPGLPLPPPRPRHPLPPLPTTPIPHTLPHTK